MNYGASRPPPRLGPLRPSPPASGVRRLDCISDRLLNLRTSAWSYFRTRLTYTLQAHAATPTHAADRVFRTAMVLAPLSDVNAGRVRHPDGEADRRSRHKGRAAGTQARTIQLPQAPWTWIRAGDRQPWIIGVPRTRQPAMPENAAAEPTATAQQ